MKNPFLRWPLLAVLIVAGLRSPVSAAPLTRAHAHNDYAHSHPLQDALDHQFSSVEADIYLVDGKLLVAHERHAVKPERTLQALYLNPLQDRVRANGGHVYRGGPGFYLLIDIKSEAGPTYEALRDVLRSYWSMLTVFRGDVKVPGAITVIISGNRPRDEMTDEAVRFAGLDGRLPDLQGHDSSTLMPWISDNWSRYFKWNGTGPFPEAERKQLGEWVQKAHDQGRLVRFWAAPDNPVGWQVLYDAGVDLINTDDLAGLEEFLQSQHPAQ